MDDDKKVPEQNKDSDTNKNKKLDNIHRLRQNIEQNKLSKEGLAFFKNTLLKNNISEMRANLEVLQESIEISSKLKWTKYNSLIREGFNEQQALYLCVHTNLFD